MYRDTPVSTIGEWIYKTPGNEYADKTAKNEIVTESMEASNIIDSITPMAKQKNWRTPTEFVCCPKELIGAPIECYFNNLSEGAVFSINEYGECIIKKFSIKEGEIFVIVKTPSNIKPYALAKITYENGYFLHTSLRSYFTYLGAEKAFTVEQGFEWTGEESIDDYC